MMGVVMGLDELTFHILMIVHVFMLESKGLKVRFIRLQDSSNITLSIYEVQG